MSNFDIFLKGILTGVRLAFQLPSADGLKLGVGWFVILVLAILGMTSLVISKLGTKKKG
jgi:hypothetical protein